MCEVRVQKEKRLIQSLRLPPDVLAAAKKAAEQERIPLSRWVERVLATSLGLP